MRWRGLALSRCTTRRSLGARALRDRRPHVEVRSSAFPVSRVAEPADPRSPGSREVPPPRSSEARFPVLRSPAWPVLLRPELPPVRTPRRSDDVFLLTRICLRNRQSRAISRSFPRPHARPQKWMGYPPLHWLSTEPPTRSSTAGACHETSSRDARCAAVAGGDRAGFQRGQRIGEPVHQVAGHGHPRPHRIQRVTQCGAQLFQEVLLVQLRRRRTGLRVVTDRGDDPPLPRRQSGQLTFGLQQRIEPLLRRQSRRVLVIQRSDRDCQSGSVTTWV